MGRSWKQLQSDDLFFSHYWNFGMKLYDILSQLFQSFKIMIRANVNNHPPKKIFFSASTAMDKDKTACSVVEWLERRAKLII